MIFQLHTHNEFIFLVGCGGFALGLQQICDGIFSEFDDHLVGLYGPIPLGAQLFQAVDSLFQILRMKIFYVSIMAMRFELATRRVTSPDSEMFTPFELQVNFTQKMLALPYQKYTFSERKFDEEFKYGFENEGG